jgi:hypothetical protein
MLLFIDKMQNKLNITKNSLKDIIDWLKQGHFVCIHTNEIWKYYYSKSTTDWVNNELLIYIDLSNNPNLVLEDEWPWYIKNEGFVSYTSSYVLPNNPENIYHFIL